MTDVNATAKNLIRKPVRDVFDAFVDPRSLEKFWLKSASGPLAQDAIVECDLKSLLETGQSGNMVRDKAVLISAARADA